ncbi:MAG TPA: PAN/Apple domain-containing protein [Thermoanaerobaculia bacterium]|nr:PAN/Apple domain-containing protein [Thermoanaerobaculia bacterium]
MRRALRTHHRLALTWGLAALLILPARPAFPQDLTEERGYDRRGDDYTSFRAESVGECKRACGREDRCQAYTWDLRSGDCYLKSRINSQKRNGDMITGYKRGETGAAPRDVDRGGSSLSEEWGYDRSGNDYRSFEVSGMGECKRACSADRRCQAYTFLTRSNTCYLKSHAGFPQRQNGAVTGAKGGETFNPWSAGLTEETGFDRRGDDYTQFRARTLGACKASCRRDSRCRAFSYIVSSGDCFLKSRINSREPNPGAVTGYKEGHQP